MAGQIGLKSIANFSKQAAISLKSGLTLSRAFPLIARETKDRRLRNTLQEINADIARGSTLTESVRAHSDRFPSLFVEMVDAGESSGHLESVFSRLADYFDTRLMLRRATVQASIYPAIQLSMAYAVSCLMIIVFSANKAATAWRLCAYTAAAVVALGIARFFFARTAPGKAIWDRFLLSVPILRSVTIKLSMARFSRSLAMQLESAIPVAEAIERSALVAGNGAIANNLKRMAEPIRHGSNLAEAVRKSKLVPAMVSEVLAVGEETGNFSEALERVADIYEDESLVVLESIPKLIGPIVAILVGLVVVYLFYTVYYVHYLKPMLDMVGV